MMLLLAFAGSYVLGSVPTGYLLVKWMKRMDVRSVGSGSTGATNVARVAGVGASAVVFFVDVAKGLLAVGVVAPWVLGIATATDRLACGLAAVLGHTFPLFLSFRGGKGVATTIGVLLAAMPDIAAVALAVWVVCFAIWRYVSVGSLAAAMTIPVMQIGTRQSLSEVAFGAALAALIVVRHRANIARLRRGEELRVGHRPSGEIRS